MGTIGPWVRTAVAAAILILPLPVLAASNIIGDGFACSVWSRKQAKRSLNFPNAYKRHMRSFVGCITLDDAVILFGIDKKGRVLCSGTGNFDEGIVACGALVGGPE